MNEKIAAVKGENLLKFTILKINEYTDK